jgi:hypothetical protein
MIDMEAEDPRKTEEVWAATVADEMTASWNAEGDRVLFVSDRSGFFEIYMLVVKGDERKIYRQGLFRGGAFQPRFSADGKSVLFSYYRSGNYSLYTIPVNTDEQNAASTAVVDKIKQDLAHHKEGKTGPDKGEAFKDAIGWNAILPLGVFNWGNAGDLLGNNEISGSFYPSLAQNGAFFSGDLMYWNRSTRFDLGAGILATSVFNYDLDRQTDYLSLVAEARYPFDPYRSAGAGLLFGTYNQYEDSHKIREQTRSGLFLDLTHDNRVYRGVSPIRGQLLTVGVQYFPGSESDTDISRYGYGYGRYEQALTIIEDHILYIEAVGGVSQGRDRLDLDIADVVRGYAGGELLGSKQAGVRVEYRFPIHRDGNYAVLGHYLLLKDIRGFAFVDGGVVSDLAFDDFTEQFMDGDLDFRHAAGAGLRIDFYGMQKAPFTFAVGLAVITDDEDGEQGDTTAFFNLDIRF